MILHELFATQPPGSCSSSVARASRASPTGATSPRSCGRGWPTARACWWCTRRSAASPIGSRQLLDGRARRRPRAAAAGHRAAPSCSSPSELGVGRQRRAGALFLVLRQIAGGIALMSEVSDRTRARVLATGELMATEIGARYLQRAGHRRPLVGCAQRAEGRSSAAPCHAARRIFCRRPATSQPDPALQAQLEALPGVVSRRASSPAMRPAIPCCSAAAARIPRRPISPPSCGARRLEIWTDVPGMFSANPRSTPQARLLRSLHYDEAQEIASSGAKVLHPRCILPAKSQQIPIAVYATQCPSCRAPISAPTAAMARHRSRRCASRRASRWCRSTAPGMWHEVGFPRRRVPDLQASRPVGRPGLHLRDQRDRLARSGGQCARSALLERLVADLSRAVRARR